MSNMLCSSKNDTEWKMSKRARTVYLSILLSFLAFNLGCAKDFVTGKPTLSMLSESQEIELGRSSHDAVIQSYGLYDDKNWQNYIDQIGQKVAKVSHRPNLEYHFYVVDSPVVNAFALPGGWIYFTRGILAHFNSEDELAGVMGHEIGHVVARHGAEQYTRQQLAGLGLTVATIASERFRPYANLAQAGLGLLFLKFSRNQESESDKLGVQYISKIGYNAHEMAGFFRTIARLSNESGNSIPNFLSTHPNPVNREARVHELTDAYRAEHGFSPSNHSSDAYIRQLSGMIYGQDPRNGYHDKEKNMFYHPKLRFQFPVPEGWKFQRAGTQFQMVNSDETGAVILLKAKEHMNVADAASKFLSDTQAEEQNRRNVRLNGFRGLALTTEISDENQSLGVLSYFMSNGKDLYLGHGFTKAEDFQRLRRGFAGVLDKFSKLTSREAMNKKPERVRITKAPRTAPMVQLLKSFGTPDERLKELSILNGIDLDEEVKRGRYIKLVE